MTFVEIHNQITKYYSFNIDDNLMPYQKESLFELLNDKPRLKFYNEQWKPFIKSIKLDTIPNQNPVSSELLLLNTCYTGRLTIKSIRNEQFSYKKKIIFHLSVINSFFTIYGSDEVEVIDDKAKGGYITFDPIIMISPTIDYIEYFDYIASKIYATFPASVHLPFLFLKERVNGLKIDTSELKEDQSSSIYQALFTGENLTDYRMFGDLSYCKNKSII